MADAVLGAYVDAQRTYAMRDRDGDGVLQYAQKLASAPGKHDGLYWPTGAAQSDEESPFGPLLAESAAYLKGHNVGDPYRQDAGSVRLPSRECNGSFQYRLGLGSTENRQATT